MAQHSYVRRESVILKCLRHDNILGFGQAINVIPHCQRQDNIPGIGGTYRVILNLIQDLKNKVKPLSLNPSPLRGEGCESVSEQRLEGFAKAKTATPFIASEQERQDNTLDIGEICHVTLNFAKRTNEERVV